MTGNLSKNERFFSRRFVVRVEAVQHVGGLHHPHADIQLMVNGRPSSVPNHDAEIVHCAILVHASALQICMLVLLNLWFRHAKENFS